MTEQQYALLDRIFMEGQQDYNGTFQEWLDREPGRAKYVDRILNAWRVAVLVPPTGERILARLNEPEGFVEVLYLDEGRNIYISADGDDVETYKIHEWKSID